MIRTTLTGSPSKVPPAHAHTEFHGTCQACQAERMSRYARQIEDSRIAAANWAAHTPAPRCR